MIDIEREYMTRNGKRVIGLRRETYNSVGERVYFPIKGSIDMGYRRRKRYGIWTEDGKFRVFGDHPFDLVAKIVD